MPRPSRDPWIAVDATIRKNAKVAQLPSDTARWGWIVVLGEAKLQRPSGYFKNQAQFTEATGRYSRFGQTYMDCALLELSGEMCGRCRKVWGDLPAGGYVVHDWLRHQRDPLAAERADDWRNEHASNADRTGMNGDQTASNSTPAPASPRGTTTTETTTPSAEGGGAGKPRSPSERQKVMAWLSNHGLTRPDGYVLGDLTAVVKATSAEAVIGSFEEALSLHTAITTKNYVKWAESSLTPNRPRNGTAHQPKGFQPSTEERDRAFVAD